jgi:hypothetical protein
MTPGFANPFERCFDCIRLVEIEAGAGGWRDRNHLPCFSGGQQFMSQTFDLIIVRHERVHLSCFIALSKYPAA